MRDMRKALVALPDEVRDIIDRDLGDTLGHGSLVDLLEEKGVITQEEWEQRIKKKLKA